MLALLLLLLAVVLLLVVLLLPLLLLLMPILVDEVVTKFDVMVTSIGNASARYPQKAATCTRKIEVGESMSWRTRGPRKLEAPSATVIE